MGAGFQVLMVGGGFTRRGTMRAGLCGLLLGPACKPVPASEARLELSAPIKRIAITIDDFAIPGDPVRALERDARIRAALRVRAAGFVSGKYEARPAYHDILSAWAADGHIIANHSYEHANASQTGTDEFWKDVVKNHDHLKGRKTYAPYFRFPFLADGANRAQQIEYYERLAGEGYRHAPVTVDSLDWFVASRMRKNQGTVDPKRYGAYWTQSVLTYAEYADELASALGWVDVPHILLAHHNIVTESFLGDLIAALEAENWQIIDAKTALDHAAYSPLPPNITAGRSLLSVHKIDRGLDSPVFPKTLIGFGRAHMEQLGL